MLYALHILHGFPETNVMCILVNHKKYTKMFLRKFRSGHGNMTLLFFFYFYSNTKSYKIIENI